MARIFLQVPGGLKRNVLKLADEIGGDVVISGENCYGACDIRPADAEALKCDKIIHYGHSVYMHPKTLKAKMPVEYREHREKIDATPIIKKNFSKIEKFNSFGLVSSVQFLDSLELAKRFLESKGKKVIMDKGVLTAHEGQILGCDTVAATKTENNIDCFLAIGSGIFHPLGLALKTDKPFFAIDVEYGSMNEIKNSRDKFLRQRYAAIALAKDAKVVGILVSVKPGQENIAFAEKLRDRMIKSGKKAYILAFDEITASKLEGIPIDLYVNTACPRIAIEDRESFKKPIINIDEMNEALGSEQKTWQDMAKEP